MLRNPEAKLEHFVSVVEGDPALTAAVLRAANSALSAPIEPIANAHEAILRVGLETARQVMLAALLSFAFDRLDDAGLDVQDLWCHLLATALLAEQLASDEDRNMAFVAGLLHDIGRLSMAAQNPARYRQVVELVRHGIAAEGRRAAALRADPSLVGGPAVRDLGVAGADDRGCLRPPRGPTPAGSQASSIMRASWRGASVTATVSCGPERTSLPGIRPSRPRSRRSVDGRASAPASAGTARRSRHADRPQPSASNVRSIQRCSMPASRKMSPPGM